MDCHAPEQNYMVVDGRHDHSFRLPRPDLSQALGSPNACTQCHTKQQPEWASKALDKWYGKHWRERPHYGTTLAAGATQGLKDLPKLMDLVQDTSSPAIVRATALTLVAPMMQPDLLIAIREQLKDSDPSVRIAALSVMESVDAVNRVLSVTPLLNDPIRGVRIEAARVLADIPDNELASNYVNARRNALKEYQDALTNNADWATENMNQGNLAQRQGNAEAAITAYQRAIRLDPLLSAAYVNLADIYRSLGRDEEGEQALHQGLVLSPKAADLHHTLGLLLVRKADKTAALPELAAAYKLAPDNSRYAYVYGIALHSTGKTKEALTVLKAANTQHPYDLDILNALISMSRATGDNKTALFYAQKAAQTLPDNAEIQQLITELKQGEP
jgi:tetratricopeptide (TPR) repeat protein